MVINTCSAVGPGTPGERRLPRPGTIPRPTSRTDLSHPPDERDIILPVKAAAIAMLLYSFISAPDSLVPAPISQVEQTWYFWIHG
jgi:hypothetical protein